MPAKLPDKIRWDVVHNWLEGYPRNTIAKNYNIGAASVSNIVDEWRNAAGPQLADTLRDLSVTLRRSGLSPAQCAAAMRIINLFDMMGYDERSAEQFLSEVYGRIQEAGITPKHIAGYIIGLKSLLDGLNLNLTGNPTISLFDIDKIMEDKSKDIRSLEEQSAFFENKLRGIRQRISFSESELHELLQAKRNIEIDLQWISDLRDQLQKNGIASDSITRLEECARFFNERRFDMGELLGNFSNYKRMQDEIVAQGNYLDELRTKTKEIISNNSTQESLLQENILKVTALETIKKMGCGLSELKRLQYILNEISKEAGLPTEENAAVKKFFQEVEEHYDDAINMEKIIHERKVELQKLTEAINITSITLNLTPEIVEMTKSLTRKGFKKDDIELIKRIIKESPLFLSQFKDKDKDKVTSPGLKSDFRAGEATTEVEKSIQSDGRERVNEQEEATYRHVPVPTNEQNKIEATDERKEQDPLVEDGEDIDFGKLLQEYYRPLVKRAEEGFRS